MWEKADWSVSFHMCFSLLMSSRQPKGKFPSQTGGVRRVCVAAVATMQDHHQQFCWRMKMLALNFETTFVHVRGQEETEKLYMTFEKQTPQDRYLPMVLAHSRISWTNGGFTFQVWRLQRVKWCCFLQMAGKQADFVDRDFFQHAQQLCTIHCFKMGTSNWKQFQTKISRGSLFLAQKVLRFSPRSFVCQAWNTWREHEVNACKLECVESICDNLPRSWFPQRTEIVERQIPFWYLHR